MVVPLSTPKLECCKCNYVTLKFECPKCRHTLCASCREPDKSKRPQVSPLANNYLIEVGKRKDRKPYMVQVTKRLSK